MGSSLLPLSPSPAPTSRFPPLQAAPLEHKGSCFHLQSNLPLFPTLPQSWLPLACVSPMLFAQYCLFLFWAFGQKYLPTQTGCAADQISL